MIGFWFFPPPAPPQDESVPLYVRLAEEQALIYDYEND